MFISCCNTNLCHLSPVWCVWNIIKWPVRHIPVTTATQGARDRLSVCCPAVGGYTLHHGGKIYSSILVFRFKPFTFMVWSRLIFLNLLHHSKQRCSNPRLSVYMAYVDKKMRITISLNVHTYFEIANSNGLRSIKLHPISDFTMSSKFATLVYLYKETILFRLFQGGIYLYQLVDWYFAAFCVLIISFLECFLIAWVYGK